ncbi:hypothetical protein EDD17DRAFT_1897227 [Pisolithus thermaeus]|nr:hypothetical protein EDD17DRAFT_1897227 [Pisolithus thermaeus]
MYGGTSDVYAVMTKYGGDTCRKTFTRDDNYRQHVRKDHPDETWVNRSGQGRQGFEPSHNVPARLVVYSFATSKTVRVEGESGVVCECTKFWTPQTYRERFGSGNNAILDRSPDAESNSARSRWAVDAGTWRELARNLSSFYIWGKVSSSVAIMDCSRVCSRSRKWLPASMSGVDRIQNWRSIIVYYTLATCKGGEVVSVHHLEDMSGNLTTGENLRWITAPM